MNHFRKKSSEAFTFNTLLKIQVRTVQYIKIKLNIKMLDYNEKLFEHNLNFNHNVPHYKSWYLRMININKSMNDPVNHLINIKKYWL